MALVRRPQSPPSKLAGLSIVDALAPRDLRNLERIFDAVDVEAGEVVVRRGRPVSWVTVVLAGELGSFDPRRGCASYGPGSLVGLAEAITRRAATADVVARRDSTLLQSVLPRFTAAFDDIPGFSRWVLQQVVGGEPVRPQARPLVAVDEWGRGAATG